MSCSKIASVLQLSLGATALLVQPSTLRSGAAVHELTVDMRMRCPQLLEGTHGHAGRASALRMTEPERMEVDCAPPPGFVWSTWEADLAAAAAEEEAAKAAAEAAEKAAAEAEAAAAAKAKAAAAAKAKAAAAAKKDDGDAEEEETEEAKAAREAKEAEEEAKKKAAEEEAKKKAAAEAKRKAEEKAAAEKAEAVACFSDPALVLTPRFGAPPASVNERADYLREKGIPDAAVQAALKELGQEEIPYERDYFGNIIAPTIIDGKPIYKRVRADGCK